MSMKDFISEMTEAGKAATGGPGVGIVGPVLIEFGLHRYVSGRDFWEFWTPVKSKDELPVKKAELTAKLKEAGSKDQPNFGVRVKIFKEVLSREQPYKKDLVEFTAVWQTDAYNLIMESAGKENLPIGETFYGQVQMKADPFAVAKGDAGKTDKDQDGNPRFPTIRVPVQKFTSAEEAQAFIDQNGASAAPAFPFSATAKVAYDGDAAVIWALQDEVLGQLALAVEGKPFNNDAANFPLPVPATPPNIVKYVATIYSLEPADIDLLTDNAPF